MNLLRLWWRAAAIFLITLCTIPMAHAVPSFARQTGSECAACHVGAYGPHLTPYGIRFKLGGYTDSDGKSGKVPLSAQVQVSNIKPAHGAATTRVPAAMSSGLSRGVFPISIPSASIVAGTLVVTSSRATRRACSSRVRRASRTLSAGNVPGAAKI